MKDRIIDSLLAHWCSLNNQYDQDLLQFYTFFVVWMQQVGLV